MKDRTPKYPGRVKLEPVAGQTNIFDMTRADEPDDTGTPFNTRTMLQDSTGRFLKLPYANPLVDDALRHMPDRIEPIGTVKTSPALSLGDAWLPCDGSQVTFAEYPQLCQLLRSTVGGTEWQSATVGTTPEFLSMSRSVKFKGKWYVAGGYRRKPNNSIANYYTFSIAMADQIEGPYSIVATKTVEGYSIGAFSGETIGEVKIQLAASDERIVAIMDDGFNQSAHGDSEMTVFFVAISSDGETWTSKKLLYPSDLPSNSSYTIPFTQEFDTDGTYWMFPVGQFIVYTLDPTLTTWQCEEVTYLNMSPSPRLRCINGTWILIIGSHVFAATTPSSFGTVLYGDYDDYSTNITYYSGRYWFLSRTSSMRDVVVVHSSTNLTEWYEYQKSGDGLYVNEECELLATERLIAFANPESDVLKTTGDPSVGWNAVTLPPGTVVGALSADADVFTVSGGAAMAYHDYSTDTRLLPTISLSDDTTTYIKAKNELDVFEAGGG